jgi:hypothetical protein
MAGGYNTTGYRNGDGVPVVQGQTAVTQITTISTGVTCSAYSGVITTVSQTVAAGAAADFTVTNTKVAATDTVVVNIKSTASAGTFIAQACTPSRRARSRSGSSTCTRRRRATTCWS